MARVLIVGCGCRGRQLAAALVQRGHAVRGTTRDESKHPAIAAAGAEPVSADPDRLGTLLPQLDGVSVLCWLMGSAVGAPEAVAALHGPRLESLLETLVDTHVRGVVYEAAGSVNPGLLEQGAELVRRASDTFRMPAETVVHDPADPEGWTREAAAAVDRVLAG
jgi:nucleoside-diphosphate-sugar epimerase